MLQPSVDKILSSAINAVTNANQVMKQLSTSLTVEQKSNPQDIVTQVDKAVEDFLRITLEKEWPDVGFLGEEGGKGKQDTEYWWIVDPIDGTTNFVNSFGFYCISLALCKKTEKSYTPLVGVVFRPSTDELYYASLNGGSWYKRGDLVERIKPKGGLLQMEQMVIAWEWGTTASNPKLFDNKVEILRRFMSQKPSIRAVRSLGSAALNLIEVATGRLDAYYEAGIHSWDIAASLLIVLECGGIVENMEQATEFDMNQRNIVAIRPCENKETLMQQFKSKLIWEGSEYWPRDV